MAQIYKQLMKIVQAKDMFQLNSDHIKLQYKPENNKNNYETFIVLEALQFEPLKIFDVLLYQCFLSDFSTG